MAGYPESSRMGSATRQRLVTPSDSVVLAADCQMLYVADGGDVAVLARGDVDAVVWPAVPAGTYLLVAPQKVLATGTTATKIIALCS